MTSPELVTKAVEGNFVERLAEVERQLKMLRSQAIGATNVPDLTEHMLINGPLGFGNMDSEPESPGPGDNSGMYSIGNIYQKDYLLKYKNGWGADMGLTGFANVGLTQAIGVTPFGTNAHIPIGCGALTETGTQLSDATIRGMEMAIKNTTGAVAGNSAGFITPFLGYTGKVKRIAGRVALSLFPDNIEFYFGLFLNTPYGLPTNQYALGLVGIPPIGAGGGGSGVYLYVRSGNVVKSGLLFTKPDADSYEDSISFEIYVDILNRRVSAFSWTTSNLSIYPTARTINSVVLDNVTLDFTQLCKFLSRIYTTENGAKYYHFCGAYVEFANENTIDGDDISLSEGWDTNLNSGAATTNYKTNAILYVGEANVSTNVWRALIKFALDTFAYTNKPPRVGEAVLNLYLNTDVSSNARRFSVYRLLKVATADATWNTYDGANNWTTAGGFNAADCEQTEIGSIDLTAAEAAGWIQIPLDVVKIEEMINGTFTNNGFLIRCDTELNDCYGFSSREGANLPYLTIYEV